MPTAFVTSAAMHVGAFFLFIYTAQVTGKNTTHVIGNVDLLIQVKRPMPQAQPAQPRPKQTDFNLFKLALPAIPMITAPRMVEVKIPEIRKAVLPEIPNKIVDRGRLEAAPKLAGADLGRKALDMAKIEAKVSSRRIAAMADAPKLEEVGRRRIKAQDLPAALAMEENRREAVALQALQPMIKEDRRRQTTMSPALAEAAPQPLPDSGLSAKLARFLPQQQAVEMQPQAAPAMPSAFKSPVTQAKAPPRKAEAMFGDKKKGVELEGPIADRKVAAYDIPDFPAWAREQGMIEASVAIRFWVSQEGDVLPNMRIEHTSGYGRLDRHAMDSLKKWKFAPVAVDEKQWGVITFRFILE